MGRTAVITGGSGGLGSAVTRAFLDAGWRVVVPVHAERERERLPEGVAAPAADLMDEASVAAVVAEGTADPQAPLAAVVNLVGGFHAGGRLHETPVEDFETQLRLNLRPAYLTCRAALPAMLAQGAGALVLVSSRAALQPFSGGSAYAVAKAAVLALVDALDVEYRQDGIRANAVLPSVIDTPGNRAAMPDADASKWVAPEQIAEVVQFLCADGSAVISGGHVPVYGRA